MILAEDMFKIGFLLIIVGFIVIFLSMMLMVLSHKGGETKGGGVILIGPFPIVFGSDTKTVKTLVLLVLILIAFIFVLTFFPIAFWR